MRDQMDAMLWNEHHDQFSEWVDRGMRAAGRGLGKAAGRVPGQLFAAVFALGLTLATLGASTA
jgi:hypothetical protein